MHELSSLQKYAMLDTMLRFGHDPNDLVMGPEWKVELNGTAHVPNEWFGQEKTRCGRQWEAAVGFHGYSYPADIKRFCKICMRSLASVNGALNPEFFGD